MNYFFFCLWSKEEHDTSESLKGISWDQCLQKYLYKTVLSHSNKFTMYTHAVKKHITLKAFNVCKV